MQHNNDNQTGELTKKDAQALRIALSLYNQGWQDAVTYLTRESLVVKRRFKQDYDSILELSKDLPD